MRDQQAVNTSALAAAWVRPCATAAGHGGRGYLPPATPACSGQCSPALRSQLPEVDQRGPGRPAPRRIVLAKCLEQDLDTVTRGPDQPLLRLPAHMPWCLSVSDGSIGGEMSRAHRLGQALAELPDPCMATLRRCIGMNSFIDRNTDVDSPSRQQHWPGPERRGPREIWNSHSRRWR